MGTRLFKGQGNIYCRFILIKRIWQTSVKAIDKSVHLCSAYEPTLNGSAALQHFEHSNVIKICNVIDFYPGLPHINM